MLLRNIVKQILAENVIYEDEGESGSVEVDKKMTEKTLKDEFEIRDEGLNYINNELARLNKKANRIGVPPLELKILKTRQVKYSDPNFKVERVVNIYTVKVEGKSPIIAGYEFIANIEHSEHGNIINISPDSSVKELPAEFRTAAPTCDYCHTKRDRANTFVFLNTETKEFKRIGRNCLKNFFPDVDPKSVLEYAALLGRMLGGLIGAESMEDGGEGGYGGSGSSRYYDAGEFLIYICIAYFLEGKRYISGKAVKAAAETGNLDVMSTAQLAKDLMNMRWESDKFKAKWASRLESARPQAVELAKKIEEWKDTKDWDVEIEKKPDMANYFHNMKVISKSPAIQYKNAGYHASLLALYLREKEWGEKKAAEKVQNATKTYVGNVGDKITFDGILKKSSSWPSNYGETYMYVFNDEKGNDIVYYSSRDLNLTDGETYKIKATVKKQQLSKYNQAPQTVITRGKVLPA